MKFLAEIVRDSRPRRGRRHSAPSLPEPGGELVRTTDFQIDDSREERSGLSAHAEPVKHGTSAGGPGLRGVVDPSPPAGAELAPVEKAAPGSEGTRSLIPKDGRRSADKATGSRLRREVRPDSSQGIGPPGSTTPTPDFTPPAPNAGASALPRIRSAAAELSVAVVSEAVAEAVSTPASGEELPADERSAATRPTVGTLPRLPEDGKVLPSAAKQIAMRTAGDRAVASSPGAPSLGESREDVHLVDARRVDARRVDARRVDARRVPPAALVPAAAVPAGGRSAAAAPVGEPGMPPPGVPPPAVNPLADSAAETAGSRSSARSVPRRRTAAAVENTRTVPAAAKAMAAPAVVEPSLASPGERPPAPPSTSPLRPLRPEPAQPRVRIGQVEVFVTAPEAPRPRSAAREPTLGPATRLYLRSV